MAGYDQIWVPPPGLADSGGFSVGYDVYDRFNLGRPFNQTLYGTEQGFDQLSSELDRAGVGLVIDSILNHNGFRDASTFEFEANGGYPGFVTTLPEDIDGDFHGVFEGGDLNGRLAGLIDIAQEKNHQFIRHPVNPGDPQNIPNETPRESNRAFYPDTDPLSPASLGDTSGDRKSPSGFNLDNPLAGDPYPENAKDLLYRYIKYMVEVKGVDGYRLDATKHIPTFFFANNNFIDYDDSLLNIGRNQIDGSPFTPFSFGENFTGDFGALAAYVRKDGYGNRDTLDFPLYFAMDSVFGGGGFGDMRNLEFASFDGNDGNANDGTLGVMFADNHDVTGAGAFSGLGNVAHAHVLTRTGFPSIYYNAKEFGDNRDFPKDGRGDALGNFGPTLVNLMNVNKEYIRGAHSTRWIDDNVYIYERFSNAIVGLNDRGDGGFDERTINTGFAEGTVLVEVTGNATNIAVDPFDDIFDQVTVGPNGVTTIRVPRNGSSNGGDSHGLGYVVYGPPAPPSILTIENTDFVIGPDPDDGRRQAVRRLTPLQVVSEDTIEVFLYVDASELTPSDNALVKVNFGELDIDGDNSRNANGLFAGFENFPASQQRGSITEDQPTTYTASIDATVLKEGYTYIETVAFLSRSQGTEPVFDLQKKVVYLDRLPPEQELLFPTQTGDQDITSETYEIVMGVDHTVNALHVIENFNPALTDEQIKDLANGGNLARKHDRLEWRYVLDGLVPGDIEFATVAFEETGNYSVVRHNNINVDIPFPQILLGVDSNPDGGAANFEGVPGSINSAAYPNDFVVRVKTQDIDGQGTNISFPNDFKVSLQIDDKTPIVAVPFDGGLLPPVGRLVQNDQAFGDEFDEFRFVWRGYGTGSHTFTAKVELTNIQETPNTTIANTFVELDTPGPSVEITYPAPPGTNVDNPTSLTVEGLFNDNLAAHAQVFMERNNEQVLLGTVVNPSPGTFSEGKDVDSYAFRDVIDPNALSIFAGTFPVRVVASTGPNGTGIVTEASSQFNITGVPMLPPPTRFAIDGNANDTLTMEPIAVSAANAQFTRGTVPADFGADGTLTEMRARLVGNTLYTLLRGEFFGEANDNAANATFLYMDINPGSAEGAINIRNDLNDFSDGLRSDISNAAFEIGGGLVFEGTAFDAVIGMTDPSTGFGYTLGTDGLGGSFSEFEFSPNIAVAFSTGLSGIDPNPASGVTIIGNDAIEIAIPLNSLGSPEISQIRFAAGTASDAGYASPNTLPENSSDEFGPDPNLQFFQDTAFFDILPGLLINEIFLGDDDFIEIYNLTNTLRSLDGYSLLIYDSDDLVVSYTFPPGTMIGAEEYFLISDEGKANPPGSSSIGADLILGFNLPWDPSRGGALSLVDQYGVSSDYVAWLDFEGNESTEAGVVPYGETFPGTLNASSSFQSLGRDALSSDSDSTADWDNTGGADAFSPTPGAVNLSSFQSDQEAWFIF